MKKILVGLLVASALISVGCKKKEEAAAGGGDSIGVQECDDYIAKYTACIGKMPAAGQDAAKQGLNASKTAWKASAATPQGKSALKTSCAAALTAMASNPACK